MLQCFLSNEHGDLYFLLHKFGENIVRKKRYSYTVTESKCANYDLENNDWRNVLIV